MQSLTWKTLSSTYIHKGPWATLRADKCEMPNGTIVDEYYVLEYPDWANAVAVTEDNKVILVRQYRQAAGVVALEIPGGVIEKDELPEVGMRRELLEETGYDFEKIELYVLLPGYWR
jgi:8-oxo-dGTP pyrophosphatase MutT (NUDIX family)